MNDDRYRQFVDRALEYQGCPYIWQGKGLLMWTPQGLRPHKFSDLQDSTRSIEVFDCSGLVTHCLALTTQIDLRATHSAKTILDTFPECDKDFGDGCLLLYPSHVAIDLGRNRVVDAHAGDSSTTSLLAAQARNAKVEAHRSLRAASSILGYRKIPLDKSELKTV